MLGFNPLGAQPLGSSQTSVTGTPPPVQKIYLGLKLQAELLLGTKTEAQLYVGANDLI